jgi:hypothetical protein
MLQKYINEYKETKCIFVLNRLMKYVAETDLSKKDTSLYNEFLNYLDNE